MPVPTDTARAASDLRARILNGGRAFMEYTAPSPFVRLPQDRVPAPRRKRLTAAEKAMNASALHLADISDRRADAEPSRANRRKWDQQRDDMAQRIASGDTSADVSDVLPVHDPAQDLAIYETLLHAEVQARKIHAANVAEYDAAVLELADEVLPAITEEMHTAADAALVAVQEARTVVGRALSSRALAHGLRAVKVKARLVERGEMDRKSAGRLITVSDTARNAVAAHYGDTDVGTAASALITLTSALEAVKAEHPEEALPNLEPAKPAPLMTREEYLLLCRRADASGQMRPPMPDHLVR